MSVVLAGMASSPEQEPQHPWVHGHDSGHVDDEVRAGFEEGCSDAADEVRCRDEIDMGGSHEEPRMVQAEDV